MQKETLNQIKYINILQSNNKSNPLSIWSWCYFNKEKEVKYIHIFKYIRIIIIHVAI